MKTGLIEIILTFVILFIILNNNKYIVVGKTVIRVCGRKLVEIMKHVCKHNYKSPQLRKRSLNWLLKKKLS